MTSIKDLLANAGGITAAFDRNTPIGAAVQGTVTDADVRQTTDFDTNKPEFWDDGSPKQQLRIVIQTDQRTSPDDDGKRAVYIKWWGEQRQVMLKAMEKAGADDVEVGGQFWARYAGSKPNEKNPRLADIKLYEYAYQKPANTAGLNMDPSHQPGQPAPQQQQQAPAFQAPQQQMPQGGGWNAPVTDPWTAGQAPQQQQQEQPLQSYFQQPDPAFGQAQAQAAQQAVTQHLDAQPVQQQQAPAPQAPAAPPAGVDVARVQQFLGMGLSDAEVAGATGTPVEHVAAIRAAG